tara:strand:- start:7231 stop:8829 length:1599 start_codon:yes stop_codon:yes gene_type:complete
MTIKSKFIVTFLLTLVALFFLKTDYRMIETIYPGADDGDHYLHATTIGIDFDLDYTNQLKGVEDIRYDGSGKIAPTAFIGSGFLSSPFVALGNLLNLITNNEKEIFNFVILFYSLSGYFYLILTLAICISLKSFFKVSLSNLFICILILSSGVSYFVFERYSISHIFEIFTTSLVIFTTFKFYEKGENKFAVLIPLTILLGILVKWTNYYLFIIPISIKLIYFTEERVKLRKNIYFLLSTGLSIFIFFLHTKILYGIFTINPGTSYEEDAVDIIDKYVLANFNLINEITSFGKSILIILFSSEFGLTWFSTINSIGFMMLVFFIIRSVYEKEIEKFIGYSFFFIGYLSIFYIIHLWESTASSYGFRYSFCLTPISLIIFFDFYKKFKINLKVIILLCLFSIGGTLFFETHPLTQLSLEPALNSWGQYNKYSQRNYLNGYLLSLISFTSYQIIIVTSFLFVYFIKFLLFFLNSEKLLFQFGKFGLPSDNEDFMNLIQNIEKINLMSLIVFFVLIFSINYYLVNLSTKNNKNLK